MKVRFWGTRGSIPRSGERVLRYGGNTACVEVLSAGGTTVVIDCGTGAVDLGAALCRNGRARRGALLISHTHWDHIQGLPFFAPLFVPGAEWDIYAPRGLDRSIRETLAGQMQHAYFPITLEAFAATIRYHELVEGEFAYQDVRLSTHYLDHPALTLGYRLEADGASVVYACDHEPIARKAVPGASELHGAERSHVGFLRAADLVIHDAQFTAAEYPSKIGWGHGTPDYAVAVCLAAGARTLALTHHYPERSDDEVEAMVIAARGDVPPDAGLTVFAAEEGQAFELGKRASMRVDVQPGLSATRRVEPALANHPVIACGLGPSALQTVRAAARAEKLPLRVRSAFGDSVRQAMADGRSTVLIDAGLAAEHADEIAGAQRQAATRPAGSARLVTVSDGESACIDGAAFAAERLVWPFSEQYVRARIRAAVLRAECRWQSAPRPGNEAERLDELWGLGILDTEREERFDRITRIAARAFAAPAALITLIDADRQWFKSCVGVEAAETTREEAFCAHAILEAKPTIVPDALEDDRFADNPAVTGGPRVRFYAGCPIRSPRGLPIGTLCVVDSQPREIDADQVELLRDLAALVEEQLGSRRRRAALGAQEE
jgi:phosphoribosyl 1,2-cyclic phosphodiesterase